MKCERTTFYVIMAVFVVVTVTQTTVAAPPLKKIEHEIYLPDNVKRMVSNIGPRLLCLDISHDDKLSAAGGDDGIVRVWDVKTRQVKRLIHSDGGSNQEDKTRVHLVAFSSDARLMATAGSDESLKIWNVASGAIVQSFKMEKEFIRSTAFDPGGSIVISVSVTPENISKIRVWDIVSGKLLKETDSKKIIGEYVDITTDGEKLIVGGRLGLQIRRLSDLEIITLYNKTLETASITGWAYARSLDAVFAGDKRGQTFLIDVKSGRPIWQNSICKNVHSIDCMITDVAITPDGRRIEFQQKDTLHVWSLNNEKEVTSKRTIPFYPRKIPFYQSSNKLVATIVANRDAIRLVDLETEAKSTLLTQSDTASVFQERLGEIGKLVYSRESGKLVWSSGGRHIYVWDIKNNKPLARLSGLKGKVRSLAVGATGKYIAATTWHGTTLWNTNSGKEIELPEKKDGYFEIAAIDKQEKLIALSQYNTIFVFDIKKNSVVHKLKMMASEYPLRIKSLENWATGLTFFKNGNELLCGNADGTMESFNLADSTKKRWPDCHIFGVTDFHFNSKTQQIASVGFRKTCIWSMKTEKRIRTMNVPHGTFNTSWLTSSFDEFIGSKYKEDLFFWHPYKNRKVFYKRLRSPGILLEDEGLIISDTPENVIAFVDRKSGALKKILFGGTSDDNQFVECDPDGNCSNQWDGFPNFQNAQ